MISLVLYCLKVSSVVNSGLHLFRLQVVFHRTDVRILSSIFRDDAATAAMVETISGELHEPQGSDNQNLYLTFRRLNGKHGSYD
jgi:hypothetical protein